MVFILRIYLAHRNKISNESNLIVYSGQHRKDIKKTPRQSQNGAKFLLILWTPIFMTFGKVFSPLFQFPQIHANFRLALEFIGSLKERW